MERIYMVLMPKITEKNFIAQAAFLLDSEDPCASFLNPQRTQHG